MFDIVSVGHFSIDSIFLPSRQTAFTVLGGSVAYVSFAARKEGKLKYVRFADRLTLHAQTEEEVYYPAAILIGEYVKLKLAQTKTKKSTERMPNKKPRSQKGKAKQ